MRKLIKLFKMINWDVALVWVLGLAFSVGTLVFLASLAFGAEKDPWLTAHPRAWTKTEKLSAVYFIVGHTLDGYTTEKMLNHGNYETNPIMGRRPSDSTVAVYFSITGVAAVILAHFSPKARKWLLLSYGTLNGAMAIRNQDIY